jgi:hypothetical protein
MQEINQSNNNKNVKALYDYQAADDTDQHWWKEIRIILS